MVVNFNNSAAQIICQSSQTLTISSHQIDIQTPEALGFNGGIKLITGSNREFSLGTKALNALWNDGKTKIEFDRDENSILFSNTSSYDDVTSGNTFEFKRYSNTTLCGVLINAPELVFEPYSTASYRNLMIVGYLIDGSARSYLD